MNRLSRLLPVLAIAALPAAGCQALTGHASEFDYLNGRMGSRYLHSFLKPDPMAAVGDPSTYTGRDPQVYRAMQAAAAAARNLDAITNVDEDLFIVIQDDRGVGYTVAIHNGDVELREGLREGVRPSLVVPLLRKEALGLPGLLAAHGVDSTGRAITGLSADGLFEIVRLLMVPGLEALYSRPELYAKTDRRSLHLDDLVQFVLLPPPGSRLHPAHVTVANVDGQWLFLQGWHGDPDVRLQLTSMQALGLYRAALYAPRKADSAIDQELAWRHFQELWNRAVVYTRSDL